MSARAPRSSIDGYALAAPHRRLRRRLALACVLGTALFGFASLASRADLGVHLLADWPDRLAAAAGLEVTRIEVRGNRYARTSDITAALNFAPAQSQFKLDLEAARHRVEALPWVLRAKLQRVLPDAVAVEVVERTPALLWRAQGRDVLVDMHGRELASLTAGSDVGLPVFTGAGAAPVAPDLLMLLQSHPEIARRVVEFRWIEGRRWSLVLAGGRLLHLPAEGLAAALAWTESMLSKGLPEHRLHSIDLRVPGQLIVRELEHQTSGTTAVGRMAGGAGRGGAAQ